MSCATTLASCVVWEGEPLKALGICTGDSLTAVIVKLVRYVQANNLTSVDITKLELHCLDAKTDTLQELIQAVITHSCQGAPVSEEERYCSGDAAVYYELPECLQYEDEFTGTVISQLSPKAYAEYVAGAYCGLQTQHQALGQQLTLLTQQLKELQRTVRTLSC